MSESKSLNISLPEEMISSTNECVYIPNVSNIPLQIIVDTWWASMTVDSKRPIAGIDATHAPSW
jgi:hypothetical protein